MDDLKHIVRDGLNDLIITGELAGKPCIGHTSIRVISEESKRETDKNRGMKQMGNQIGKRMKISEATFQEVKDLWKIFFSL